MKLWDVRDDDLLLAMILLEWVVNKREEVQVQEEGRKRKTPIQKAKGKGKVKKGSQDNKKKQIKYFIVSLLPVLFI